MVLCCLVQILLEHLVTVITVLIVLVKVEVIGLASTERTSERKIKGSINECGIRDGDYQRQMPEFIYPSWIT